VKHLRFVLALLIPFTFLTAIPTAAVAADVAPFINYSGNSGLNFVAIPAQWSVNGGSKFQWFVGGKAISGATKLSFKATSKQKGQRIEFRETRASSVSSSVTAKIGQIIVNVKPKVTLLADAGNTASITAGLVSPKASKVAYQWYKGPIDIAGAKSASYKPATADQGFKIYVNAKYTFKGFTENTVDSNEVEIPVVKRTYKLLWQEEFNGAAGSLPDPKIWTSEDGDGSKAAAGGGWGNRERQYYIPTLAKITTEGAVQIDATTSGANAYTCYYRGPCEWISAKYITKDKVGFKYGRMEARIKGPVGAGTWGAFWMLGADIDERAWPWCGEIDITELVGKNPNLAYGYLHGLLSGGFGGRGATVDMPKGFADEYHTYAIDWLPDQIDWYVDGVLFGSQQKVDRDWVFDHEFYLIMNLAMGGNLGGPIESGLNKASMSFDWIRFSSINGVGEVIKR
jgi:beta-glucanase (GH16 family)